MKMADEDEIDVLGDFSLDNLLSKNESGISSSCYDHSVLTSQNSELLSYDYSLNSQWLLENPTSNADCWYTDAGNDFNTDDGNSETNTSLGFDEVICTENKTTDESGWTEEEKNSLLKGLEIFGKNATNLSQFIGSKTASQVKYYLKHFYMKSVSFAFSNIYNTVDINKPNKSSNSNELPAVFKMSDIIEDAQIPASIEEVIAAVSTAKPTVQNICKKPINTKKKPNNFNISATKKLKFNNSLFTFHKKFYKRPNLTIKHQKTVERKRTKPEESPTKTEPTIKEETNNLFTVLNIFPFSSGEEVIKIKKESESESDTEIDIDIDEDEAVPTTNQNPLPVKEESIKVEDEEVQLITQPKSHKTDNDRIINYLLSNQMKSMSDSVRNFFTSIEIPSKECLLEDDVITEEEKYFHPEFFEGRPTKTPSRYLKIRNHIIDYWLENKPQYCTKTSVRQGLKNCGDVNRIGRVHQYLEQIGAINFGCEQTNYIRPLMNMMTSSQPNKEKTVPVVQQKTEIIRPRMKKKYNNDGEGGYTMMHDENGEIIDTTVINEDKQAKPRTNRRQNIKLVYCKGFTDEYPAPYSVSLHISALLLIDIHAHSALIEVMGLLGGTYDQKNHMLHITRYIPCLGIDHSNTHCDMCPVSQSEASEALQAEGVVVVGWFHSHPTFYPNPSLQDIDTQLNMQLYLSSEYKPFVGVILSPFRALATALVSEYRCLIVERDQSSDEDVGVPYKFQTGLSSSHLDVGMLLKHAREMFKAKSNIPKGYVIDFQKPYFQDTSITYLEKLLASVNLHLARCSEINKMTCDAIIQGITEICLQNTQ